MRRTYLRSGILTLCHGSLWLFAGCSGADSGDGGETSSGPGTQDSSAAASETTQNPSLDPTDGSGDMTATDPAPVAVMAVDDVFDYHEDLFTWSVESPTVLDNDDVAGVSVSFESDDLTTEQGHEVRLGRAGEVEWIGDGAIVDDAFTYTLVPFVADSVPSSARVELAVQAVTHDVEDLRADGRSTAISMPEGLDLVSDDLGDLDGDGYGDFGVFSGGRFDIVVRDGGALPSAVELAAGAPGFSVASAASVHAAGDFNGDGIDDLMVRGGYALSIVFGGTDLTDFSTEDPAGEWGFRITEEYASFAPRAVGDVDGDGREDVVIDDTNFAVDNGGGGRAIVILGRDEAGTVSFPTLLAEGGGYSVTASALAHSVAEGLEPAGDVNGDGLDDWLLSGRYEVGGAAWVIFGTQGRNDIDLDELGDAGFEVLLGHDAEGSPFGASSISGIGDYDADGLDDVAFADDHFSHGAGADYRGRIVVVWGKATSAPVDFDRLGEHGRTIDIRDGGAPGILPAELFGEQVTALGDIDGDGRDDLAFACHDAFRHNPRAGQVGRIYVVLGREREASVSVPDLSRGEGGFVLVGGRDDRAGPASYFACLDGPDGCELLVGRRGDDNTGLELVPLAPLAGG